MIMPDETTTEPVTTETEPTTGDSQEPDTGQEPDTTGQEPDTTDEGTEPDPETFPKAYVVQLRTEAKDHRTKAKEATDRADALAKRLHTALVTATGRLADPTDLEFDPEHLDDPEALTAAIDGLLARKPHLASRRPVGNVGQGETGGTGGSVDLAALLRSRA